MYDPCVKCPCVLRREVCRKFCTIYKAAIRKDAEEAYIDHTNQLHNRIVRREGKS